MVAAEAQACGTPVVAFRRGALEEVILDGVTGFLVAPDDIGAAAGGRQDRPRSRAAMPRACRKPSRSRTDSRRTRTALRASRWARSGREPVAEWRHWLDGTVGGRHRRQPRDRSRHREAIAAAGAHVVLAARDGEALEVVAAADPGRGRPGARGTRRTWQRRGGRRACLPTVERMGTFAALVCAAGVLTPAPFVETTPEIWEQTLAVNLTGSFLCCRAAFAAMRAAGEGRIVNIGVAVRRLRDREVPRADRIQRLQVRGHRAHRGDRGRG